MLYLFRKPTANVIAANHNHLLFSELMYLMTRKNKTVHNKYSSELG